jgi:hypothetical protein
VSTTVALELRDGNGSVVATTMVTLQPYQLMQVPMTGATGLFGTVFIDISNDSASFVSGSPIFAYASIIDNTSGDASFVTPSVDQTTLSQP